MEAAEGRACAFIGTCGECRNYRTCSGAAAGGPCSSEEPTTLRTDAVEELNAARGTVARLEVPQPTATYNAVGHSYGPQTTVVEEATPAPEEPDQQEADGNATTSEPVEPTTTALPASLMQGDEGGDGSTVGTRDQMAAESELLACQREAAAGYEAIDRRNNEEEAERQEIIRQENDRATELRDGARERRRRASIVEATTEESRGSPASPPEVTEATPEVTTEVARSSGRSQVSTSQRKPKRKAGQRRKSQNKRRHNGNKLDRSGSCD